MGFCCEGQIYNLGCISDNCNVRARGHQVVKRIFIGIDGTSNSAFFDRFYSNVYRMNLALAFNNKDGSPQLFIYFSGVGTASYKWLGLLGKAFGEGIDALILQAYVNLVANYEAGDKIYVFGFSRGAVAARALTGMISKSGLVRYECSPSIAAAWQYFIGDDLAGNYRDQKPNVTHEDAAIEFLGVWDTVYGIDPKLALRKSPFMQLRFPNFHLDQTVKTGIHILSIDDTRKFFRPMLWDKTSDPKQTMEQIWMPGVHSDIGGGYEKAFISTVSLLTMIDRLTERCPDVDFDADYIKKFLLPRLEEDVAINNEWQEHISFLYSGNGRPCDMSAKGYGQSVHPLLAALMGKEIFFKTKPMQYAPSYALSAPDVALRETAFKDGSHCAGAVAEALKAKFN
jgi:uncharacterized protein (DUF2235 family)